MAWPAHAAVPDAGVLTAIARRDAEVMTPAHDLDEQLHVVEIADPDDEGQR